jgi:hypothetical protein
LLDAQECESPLKGLLVVMEAERRVCPGLAALELSCRATRTLVQEGRRLRYFNNDWEGYAIDNANFLEASIPSA